DEILRFFERPEFKDSISGKYLRLLSTDRKKKFVDRSYGVRKQGENYIIGNSPITFEEDSIIVNGKNYPKTVGLMELLISKEPKTYLIENKDNKNYVKILTATNAHRKEYKENADFKNKNSKKFKTYISPLVSEQPFSPVGKKRRSITGEGVLPRYKVARIDTSMDYVYWNDPNELVDRLRLLIAEQSAGNPSHGGSRGPPGVGYKITTDGQYNVDDKRLCNTADPKESKDAVNLDTVKRMIKLEVDGIIAITTRLQQKLDELDTQVDLHRDDLDKQILTISGDITSIKGRLKKQAHRIKANSGGSVEALKDGASKSS
ncbi:hypothetical protein KM043_000020, partial [Ampulex compressa]